MIQIIEGDNILLSRQYLLAMTNKSREKGLEILQFNGKKVQLEDIRQAVGSNSLFGQDKMVIIENLLTSIKSSRKQEISKYIFENKTVNQILLWEESVIDKRTIPRGLDIQTFKIETNIFHFLDNLKPDNRRLLVLELKELLKNNPPEMIFYLLIRHFRFLLIASQLKESGLEKLAPWQKYKFIKQASLFNYPFLYRLYRQLLEIDYNQKSGFDILPLDARLDVFLANL